MNDKTENASASEPETPISSPASTTASRPYSEPKDSTTAPQKRKSGAGPAYALTAVVVVLAAAGLWYQNSLLEKHKAELQSQLATNINTTEQARQTAQQALALAQRQSDKLTQLEKSFNDSTEQFHDLSQAFQTMTDSGSELVLLNDIDHLATIAQQQLMLGGNVANAIVSLEAAQAQLARANRVGLASLQQTLNGDLERLRAAATVDVASLSRQLDTLSRYVSEAPLLVPDDVAGGANTEALDLSSEAAAAPADLPDDAPWWERSWNTVEQWGSSAWRSVSHDLGQFVSIRRVDDAAAATARRPPHWGTWRQARRTRPRCRRVSPRSRRRPPAARAPRARRCRVPRSWCRERAGTRAGRCGRTGDRESARRGDPRPGHHPDNGDSAACLRQFAFC